MATVNVLGISGSLRQDSHNFKVLRAASELLPKGMSLTIADPLDFPMYSDAAERAGMPAKIQQFREQIARANAFLFASPEYNYSISAALKNALEWASRPPNPPFAGKTCAILGATTSPAGTFRGQSSLRQICVSLNLLAVNVPQVDIAEAQKKFDADGKLTDQGTKDLIRQLLNSLDELTAK